MNGRAGCDLPVSMALPPEAIFLLREFQNLRKNE
jgi:hypothetical protein